jgi:hypothetical protein
MSLEDRQKSSMTRRQFIFSTCIFFAWVAQPRILGSASTMLQERIRKCGLHEFGYDVNQVGQGYIRLHPDEANLERLGKILYWFLFPSDSVSGKKEIFRRYCREDFKKENMFVENGWILSQTEARFCAYYYLLNSDHVA